MQIQYSKEDVDIKFQELAAEVNKALGEIAQAVEELKAQIGAEE